MTETKELKMNYNKKIKVGLIGAGQRGNYSFGDYAINYPENIEYVSLAEPNEIRRKEFAKKHNIALEYQFNSWEELLGKEKHCDAIIITTPDDIHFEPAKLSLLKGYHLLLEKPMSNTAEKVIELGNIARENNNIFMICHILRYASLFSKVKEIVDSGLVGKVQTIQYNENIGYFHFAHAFVRGNWRNSDLSSPLILQKSCHDMDIFLWLLESDCKKIASFGSLNYFNKSHKPEGASDRCITCPVEKDCPYSALKLYYENIGQWPTTVITEDQSKGGVEKALKEGPYGRCVYECDNNVVDHQSTILEFENGVTINFSLSGFTNKIGRTFKIMGSKGEMRCTDIGDKIEVEIFDSNEIRVSKFDREGHGHKDADKRLMDDFLSLISHGNGKGLTSAERSVQSHMMAFAAEEARLKGKIVNMKEYYKKYYKE